MHVPIPPLHRGSENQNVTKAVPLHQNAVPRPTLRQKAEDFPATLRPDFASPSHRQPMVVPHYREMWMPGTVNHHEKKQHGRP